MYHHQPVVIVVVLPNVPQMEFALLPAGRDRANVGPIRQRPRPHPNARSSVRQWIGAHLHHAIIQLEDAWVAEELRQEEGRQVEETSFDHFAVDLDQGLMMPPSSRPFLERIADAAVSVRDNLQPQGDVPNDSTKTQRALNILTSLPICLLGLDLRGKVRTAEGRSYANSVIVVGLAATLYHASWGRVRRTTRKLDYYAISYSSAKLLRALWPGEAAKRAEHVMHCVTPFRPFWISTVGATAMQAEFVRLAAKHESLRPALRRHLGAAVASGLAFASEDIFAENSGFVGKHMHSLWHLASTYGLWTIGELVQHKEHVRGFAATRSARLFDSATSLNDLQYASKEETDSKPTF